MQAPPIEIEALAAADLAEAAAIHTATFPDAWKQAELAALLSLDTTLGLGARISGNGLAGFVLIQLVADEAEILTVAVQPHLQRHGTGRSLLAAVAEVLAARGARMLRLEVAADNAPALALYRAAGFIEAGRRAGYYERRNQPPCDAILMRKMLAEPWA
jgi:ribosomal-protein-alanine N-acetyltransferase